MNTLKDIESSVLEQLKRQFAPTIYELWFKSLQLVSLDGNTAVFSTDSNFKQDLISARHAESIKAALREVIGFEVGIVIESREERDGFVIPKMEDKPEEEKPSRHILPDEPEPKKIDPEEAIESSSIVDEYTFENFIEGESNRFALAACRAVALYSSSPDKSDEMDVSTYNPLFIYGPSGVGKTHLLFAVTNEIKKRNPKCKIVYKKSEEFTNELIESLKNGTQDRFRQHYRNADVLLIDDVQFIAGKESTQEEFFHTFSTLYENGKQIILTSDRPPKDIKTLEDRLLTRFIWGLLADIQPPSFELRTAIINKKAENLKISIPGEVVEYLATKLQNNIRQIEGSIKRIAAISLLTGSPVTTDLCRRAILDIQSGNEPVDVTVDRIISLVSKRLSIPVGDIRSKQRTANVVNARHVSIYMIRQLTDVTFNTIGEIFGRDHSTIMAAFRRVESMMTTDPEFAALVNGMMEEIRN
ncbi:MAG: chromosomal replication initiator protein DnaA [Clostridia bacterium]|nr:chromosomal replication initiator protein DnaA [Clostridia bacterium]